LTAAEVMEELKSMGNETTKKTFLRHGAKEPFFGVKIGDMKKIQKRVKKDYRLALELYDTGNSDAMYLAGLIADDEKMTKKDLRRWADGASWGMISEYTVPWVAAGSPHGWELALEWIESEREDIAACGWATLASMVSIKPDEEMDLTELKKLLQRVQKTIHQQPNRVRYVMNSFVIALGAYVKSLTNAAIQAAEKIGEVSVDMGDTACQVPLAADYIRKVQARGTIGKKRKSAKC
jgi:3-methyladenine DNA glycosylase AlkD